MTTYQPGDVIRDSGGRPVIIHDADGRPDMDSPSYDFFLKAVKGEVPKEEYARVALIHTDIQIAYSRGSELPEGVRVTHEPELIPPLL